MYFCVCVWEKERENKNFSIYTYEILPYYFIYIFISSICIDHLAYNLYQFITSYLNL